LSYQYYTPLLLNVYKQKTPLISEALATFYSPPPFQTFKDLAVLILP